VLAKPGDERPDRDRHRGPPEGRVADREDPAGPAAFVLEEVPGGAVEPRPCPPPAEVGMGGVQVRVVVPDVALREHHVPGGMALAHPGDVAEHVDRDGEHQEGQQGQRDLPQSQDPPTPHDQEDEAQETPGPEARPARGESETQEEPRHRHSQEREALLESGPHERIGGRDLEEHREDVGHRDAALHEVDPVRQQQPGGQEGGPFGGQHPPGKQEEDGSEEHPRDRGGQPPGPGLVPEGPHPHRDQQLGRGGMDPLGGRLPLEVLPRGLGVIDLVEVFLGRVGESRQAEDGGHHEHEESDAPVPRGRPPGGGHRARLQPEEVGIGPRDGFLAHHRARAPFSKSRA
jgi:hypothetical protein